MDKRVRKVRNNSRADQILRYLALSSGILLISTVAPMVGSQLIQAGINSYFHKKKFARKRFLEDARNLQRRELVSFRELANGEIEITLRQNRKNEIVLHYQLENLRIRRPSRWDGEWRLVMFDIPHGQKKARDALREKLRGLGFYAIQKSVFIIPWPCEKEIDFIASIFGVRRHILILYISRFEGEEKLRHYFKI